MDKERNLSGYLWSKSCLAKNKLTSKVVIQRAPKMYMKNNRETKILIKIFNRE